MKKSTKYLKIFCNLGYALAALLLICFLLPKVLVFFMPFVIGFILSLIANPVVRFLEKKIKIKRKYGTVLIIVLVIAAVVLLCYGVIAALVIGIGGFLDYLPTMFSNAGIEIETAIDSIQNMIWKVPFFRNVDIPEVGNRIQESLSSLVIGADSPTITAIGGIAKSIPNMLVSAVMGLLATYFFIADREKLMVYIRKITPDSIEKNFNIIYGHFKNVVGGYFKAQFRIMGVVALILFLGFLILRALYRTSPFKKFSYNSKFGSLESIVSVSPLYLIKIV